MFVKEAKVRQRKQRLHIHIIRAVRVAKTKRAPTGTFASSITYLPPNPIVKLSKKCNIYESRVLTIGLVGENVVHDLARHSVSRLVDSKYLNGVIHTVVSQIAFLMVALYFLANVLTFFAL